MSGSQVAPAPDATVRAPRHLVSTADHLATSAGTEMFTRGGNAVDAALAASAALAVTSPHLCGMGGDLFALVHVDGIVHALDASGRAGSGADADAVRAEGLTEMPFRNDIRSVTVPGCVDGWMALHERFGSLPLGTVLAPAIGLAADGFPASPLLVASLASLDGGARVRFTDLVEQATTTGARVRRPGVALALTSVAARGSPAFYGGVFGEGLVDLGDGWFTEADLLEPHADWVDPLTTRAVGVDLHTMGPTSQGYLTLGGLRLAGRLDLPDDPDDPRWAHLLIEAAAAAGHDRPDVLYDGADGAALLAAIHGRETKIDPGRASGIGPPGGDGDTTYLCTAGTGSDGQTMAVSLINSNASGFGSHLVEPTTGINLHNRGIGFSLRAGHGSELAPRKRPPHTLSPALATRNGDTVAVFGTMGGDAQPQILLQIAMRLFHHHHTPGQAIRAGRWALQGPGGFDTWTTPEGPHVAIEGHAPAGWAEALTGLGHRCVLRPAWDSGFGHAHVIVIEPGAMLAGAADPRCVIGACAGG